MLLGCTTSKTLHLTCPTPRAVHCIFPSRPFLRWQGASIRFHNGAANRLVKLSHLCARDDRVLCWMERYAVYNSAGDFVLRKIRGLHLDSEL